jgi:hypothetical protein
MMFAGSMTFAFAAGVLAAFTLRVAAFATFAFTVTVFFTLTLILHGDPVLSIVSWTVGLSMVLQTGYLAGALIADALYRYVNQ